ncbi:MAG: dockerin type I repeat-containing protein [Planctomycetota bacterium]
MTRPAFPSSCLTLLCAFASCVAIMSHRAAAQFCLTTESCLTTHNAGGCNSQACCETVCFLDPTCCTGAWDSICVFLANEQCVGYCGAAASGSCYVAHANPNCDRADCCTAVCAFDPFCCNNSWDLNCAQLAGFACPGTPGTCGTPSAGSCFETHVAGACSDLACCTAVCTIDPTCCSSGWDFLCVLTAEKVCVAGCVPVTEPDAQAETEQCDQRQNDPCYASPGGTPQPLEVGRQMKGTLGRSEGSSSPPDADVYRFTAADTDGDGIASISITFASSPGAWAVLLPDTACAPVSSAIRTLQSQLCVDATSEPVCVPAGNYRILVAAGTYPQIGVGPIGCLGSNAYTVKVTVGQLCSSPCAGSNLPCFAPHSAPGCSDAACCAAVCIADDFCCDTAWDDSCVALAAQACLSGPPANDACSGALPIAVGDNTVNTLRSTLEIPATPKLCKGAAISRDVWAVFESDVEGLVDIETCGSWFDTVLAVYTGDCGNLQPVGCSDTAFLCAGLNASRVTITAACGVRYFVRVGPKSGEGGQITLRVVTAAPVCAPCPADINGDGFVNASDLSTLLGAWGFAGGDLNGDGTTNAQDLSILLGAWGACP